MKKLFTCQCHMMYLTMWYASDTSVIQFHVCIIITENDYELEYVNNNIMHVKMYMEYTRHYERSAFGITDTQAL